jgi:hypothetical protein
LSALREAVELIERGAIGRTVIGPRLVHYEIPEELARRDLPAALGVMPFNAPLSRRALLSRHARARLDRERVQLVSVAVEDGWYHDLWYPGYTWAETVGLWRPPGLTSAGSSNLHHLGHGPLDDAARELGDAETGPGRWVVTSVLSPFRTLRGRGYSVVCSFLADDKPAVSRLPPGVVAAHLAPAFERT